MWAWTLRCARSGRAEPLIDSPQTLVAALGEPFVPQRRAKKLLNMSPVMVTINQSVQHSHLKSRMLVHTPCNNVYVKTKKAINSWNNSSSTPETGQLQSECILLRYCRSLQ